MYKYLHIMVLLVLSSTLFSSIKPILLKESLAQEVEEEKSIYKFNI